MKFKRLSISLIISSLVLVGCSNDNKSPIKSFSDACEHILTKHNYSAHLVNQWDTEDSPWFEANFYNINNDVIYDDIGNLDSGTKYYSGYIKQKGQGIVNFRAPVDGTGIVTGSFIATNLERNVSDVYARAPENIVSAPYTYDNERKAYVCNDFDAITVIANLAFGEYTSMVSAPEAFTGVFKNNKLTITAIFDVYYFYIVEVHAIATVTLTFTHLGSTHNKSLEDYVKNPSVIYNAPTAWDQGSKHLFNQYFNGVIPPFIDGLSYSWKYGTSSSEGSTVVMVEDYFNGDLTSTYEQILLNNDFKKSINPYYVEYVKTIQEELIVKKYYVKMKYYAPTDVDAGGMFYGYLFPNGVSSFKFLYTEQTVSEITNVGLLNEYIGESVVGNFFPTLTLDDECKVTNFKDASGTIENMVFLLKGDNSQYFKIYPGSKEAAVQFISDLRNYLEAHGFDCGSGIFGDQYWYVDDYFSEVRFTDPESISEWSENTAIKMRIGITQDTLDNN